MFTLAAKTCAIRRVVAMCGALILGYGLSVAAAEPASAVADLGTRKVGVDWPAFLGPTADSKSSETGLAAPWPENGPRVVWHRRVGTGYSIPSISRGRLFQFSRFGAQTRLECLRSETGAPLWTFDYASDYADMYGYDNGPRCQPIVDDDRVYTFGAEGMLHCLDVTSGKLLWKVDTAAQFGVIQNFFGVGGAPVIEGDLLIANIGGSPADDRSLPPGALDRVSGNGSGVVAFDKRTGQVAYRFSDELASYASPRMATIAGRRWGFVLARGGLIGFEPKTGKQDFFFPWRSPTLESVNASTPVVVDDLVFISETYGPGSALVRAKPGEYELIWKDEPRARFRRMQTHWNTAVYHEGFLYGSSGRHTQTAELRCIELKTGEVKWSRPDLTRCSLMYVDGHLVCLAESGELMLLKANPEKFDLVSHALLRAPATSEVKSGAADEAKTPPADEPPGEELRLLRYPAWGAPILSHGLMYVRGADRLVCVELIPDPK
ncbi:MAG: PQQ-like beta-propeller repeat protein [Planctomycetes bacterium]|nr:PQQ-like beta-propeller repeat protein [Planctomycetota bacterium]